MITVFTPTYNRAHTIHRVWDSLNSQTFTDFEWVIVDDGSSDNIDEIVSEYKSKSIYPIIFYKYTKNKGKHIATNKALELATRPFFVVADSDDAFTPDALQFFIDGWESIPLQKKDTFCGIRVSCKNQKGIRISDTLPYEPLDATMSDVFYIYNFRNESWCMVLTDWHRNFLFPTEYKGYYPEGIIWKAMSKMKNFRFYNKETRIYFVEDDNNSLMRGKIHPRFKVNRNLVSALDILNNDFNYFNLARFYFLKITTLYICYSLIDNSLFKSYMKLNNIKARLLFLVILPIGFCAFVFKSIFH